MKPGRSLDLPLCTLLSPFLLLLSPILWVAGRIGGYQSLFFIQTRVGFAEPR